MKAGSRSINMLQPGDQVKVKNCAGGYPLPAGLLEGTLVTILDKFDYGYYTVTDARGSHFRIFCACVDL